MLFATPNNTASRETIDTGNSAGARCTSLNPVKCCSDTRHLLFICLLNGKKRRGALDPFMSTRNIHQFRWICKLY